MLFLWLSQTEQARVQVQQQTGELSPVIIMPPVLIV